MATAQKRGNSYRITVSSGYDAAGKQVRKTMTWTPEPGMTERQIKKELERQTVMFEEKVRLGGATCRTVKFQILAEEWLELEKKLGNMKQSSWKRMYDCRDRTYAAIGHINIDKLGTRHIQAFINNLAEDGMNKTTGGGLSTKTQSHYLTFISDVFRYAIRCGFITSNPCQNVQTIKKEPKKREILTIDETKELLAALETAPIKYKVFFHLAIFGGFRRGEMLGLEWKDIDFKENIISINRTSVNDKLHGGVMTDTPKTASSRRLLKMPDFIFAELRELKISQTEERLQCGDQWQDHDRLFTQWNGAPMSTESPRCWLEKFCNKNNLKFCTIHAFRHLNASLLISSGIDARTVSAVLGHSQTSTTLNIYAHAFAEERARTGQAVANALDFNIAK